METEYTVQAARPVWMHPACAVRQKPATCSRC